MKSCNDHFKGRETLKLPRLLSLQFPFRARNGGEKHISSFPPVAHVVVYKHSKAFVSVTKEILKSSERNVLIQCNGTAFIA